ncbi:uncharacterized protein A1O9_06626 [Exophiala aquamarina CBS 119918]|uniref:Amidohydrolase-related domain-containing protein n=1 Tax=Exophiala aquamarina CBS 119918 TaxID=1182545 RepID=A0A072PT59_9EURO|nr:uncharacterized protein A1O9_06626 [Exophiala aquamarina CBS 119918]KEF58700.1 hypothetical protein A1O9_06626 [Exophiala aquamarina CBS 119918]
MTMPVSERPTLEKITIEGISPSYLCSEFESLRVIGVEEHVSFPELTERIPNAGIAKHARRMFRELLRHESMPFAAGRVSNVAEKRIADMDAAGVRLQVLSLAAAVNSMHLGPEAGLQHARDVNDSLKEAVATNPTRFVALAELPVHAPDLAISELQRCVKELGFVGAMVSGSIGGEGRFLDDPEFDELLSEFERLDVPLFLHPGIAPESVQKTYYDFVGKPKLSATFGGMGWGWHNEVAIHVIRLAVSGTLDKHPRLKLVVGHQGEMLPMMLQRLDAMFDKQIFGLRRSVGEALRSQVWIAISGFFSLPPTQVAIQTWGVDRVLFANDYPFIDSQKVPGFLRALGEILAPPDMRKVCQGNAELLFKIEA